MITIILMGVIGLGSAGCAHLSADSVAPPATRLPTPLDTSSVTAIWVIADQTDMKSAEIDEMVWLRVGKESLESDFQLASLMEEQQRIKAAKEAAIIENSDRSDELIVVYFNSARTEPLTNLKISPNALKILKSAHFVTIEGHADSQGGRYSNILLGERRAKMVKQWMIGHGLDPSRIEIVSAGSAIPVASNKTDAGRKLNRRVVVRLASS